VWILVSFAFLLLLLLLASRALFCAEIFSHPQLSFQLLFWPLLLQMLLPVL
jgi:hypothetical protein